MSEEKIGRGLEHLCSKDQTQTKFYECMAERVNENVWRKIEELAPNSR